MTVKQWRWLAGPVPAVLVLGACGGGLSGAYGGEQCLYDKLEFKGDDTAYVTFFGVEQAGSYRIDGDRVILSVPSGEALVFTRKGRDLTAGALGETMVCSPL